MQPNDLAAIGRFIYGERWQSALSRALNVSDRTMRHWKAGKYPIPEGAAADVCFLAAFRQWEMSRDIVAGCNAPVDLYVYRDGLPVVSPHQREWSNAVDKQIKIALADIMRSEGFEAKIVVC